MVIKAIVILAFVIGSATEIATGVAKMTASQSTETLVLVAHLTAEGSSWTATLKDRSIVVELLGKKPKVSKLSARDWSALVNTVKESRLYEMDKNPGGGCDDCAECRIQFGQGPSLETVKIYSPQNSIIDPDVLQRFMSVWQRIKKLGNIRVKDACHWDQSKDIAAKKTENNDLGRSWTPMN
jgi:hypothetical protein